MKIVAKTLHGLESVLANELMELGVTTYRKTLRAVEFEGGLEMLYRANLHCRTALSLLVPIHDFTARDENQLYDRMLNYDWFQYLDPAQTFMIKSMVKSPYFKHSKYCALLVKDALVDCFNNRVGSRPNVSTKDPDLVFVLKIHNDKISLLLDSSGPSLNKRGYRIRQGPAPLNEVLAAGMILLSGWDQSVDFLDPMCGSGTLAIEAAMIAAQIPPQAMRKSFGFQHWQNYDKALWNQIRQDWQEKKPKIKIIAQDSDIQSINLARLHAEKMDVDQFIEFNTKPFEQSGADHPVHIIMNPPYDERVSIDNVFELYGQIGTVLKHNFPGSSAWILSSHHDAIKKIGLRPSKKITLYNGQLECKYQGYELFSGKRKTFKQNLNK